ncbi:MAG: transcription antitermination factor NusB [Flavobacteriaceae bacterium]|nr:transcription antitermination factor NusB [Flavobacteriaceae bacterium]
MLNRRHIRIKVMQSIYALLQSKNDDLVKEEKFLHASIQKIEALYVLMLSMLIEVRQLAYEHIELRKKKYLATSEDKNPNRKFVENQVLKQLINSPFISQYIADNKLHHWKEHNEYVRVIWDEIKKSDRYENYINASELSFNEDKDFIIVIYKEIIAPNEKLFDYLESENISWVDDIPLVNTFIVKKLTKLNKGKTFNRPMLFRDDDDRQFVSDLFKKTALHHNEFTEDIDEKTPNWDTDRIAELDLILMKMALTEFVYFPSIPTKVTINEYIEIAKDYSTTKSSFFINGVLDKLSKEYSEKGKIQKIGRGLL